MGTTPRNTENASLTVANDPRAIEQAQAAVIGAAERLGYPKASVFALRLALHEAVTNAFKHGHKDLPASVPVTLRYKATPETIDLVIEDQGPGFKVEEVPDPTTDENLERGSGRGLLLIRAYMSTVEYNERGNALHMVYKRPAGK
jgi:serine/threonine-protein kinase RsbW